MTSADPPKSRAGRNLPVAIAVGLGLFTLIAVTLMWFNWGFILLAAVAFSLGCIEVYRALLRKQMTAAIVPIVIGTIVIIIGSYLSAEGLVPGIASDTFLLGALGLTVLAALVWRMPQGPDGYVRDAAASLFIIGYIPLMASFTSLLLAPPDGRGRIITVLVCVIASDTGGFAFGVLFGKHPMAPVISPKKTWEGLLGGLICCVAGAILCVHFILGGPWIAGVVLGVALLATATVGDLVESLIKRDVGLKDMSNFLPEHGGIMDRLDSILLSMPVAWLILDLMVPVAG